MNKNERCQDENIDTKCVEKDKNRYDMFSLQNFVKVAYLNLKKEPGNWFRPTTFVLSLKDILEKKFKKIKVLNVIDNVMCIKDLIGVIYDRQVDIKSFHTF